jgi:hypothetical protein
MSYKHECRYCGEMVTYASIWEAELYLNHSCDGLIKKQRDDRTSMVNEFLQNNNVNKKVNK